MKEIIKEADKLAKKTKEEEKKRLTKDPLKEPSPMWKKMGF